MKKLFALILALGLALPAFGAGVITNHWTNAVIDNLVVKTSPWRDVRAALAVADNTTVNTTYIQAALDNGGVVLLPYASTGIYVTGALTASKDNTTIILGPGVTLKFNTLGASTNGITANVNNFEIIGGLGSKIVGPNADNVYVGDENGISFSGTSTSARKSRIRIAGVEISNFGSHGIYGKWADDVVVERNYIHDCGYAGAMFLSCDNGRFLNNTVKTISPGASSNMYGVSLTHDSVGYDGLGRLSTNPFCRGWNVSFNEISDINWEGIDTHGAFEVQIIGNRVYATKHGISAPSSSGDAVTYSGEQNMIALNIVDSRNKDGTLSGRENQSYGINVNGGSTLNNLRIVVANNTVVYKGIASNSSSGAIQAVFDNMVKITGNIIDLWHGNAIYAAVSDVSVESNTIGGMASATDTVGYIFGADAGTSKRINLVGNTHSPTNGIVAKKGVVLTGSTTPILFASGNDFSAATLVLNDTNSWMGSQWGNTITSTDNNPGTINVASLAGANTGTLLLTSDNTYTITNLTGGVGGQTVTIINTGTGNVTFSRTGSFYLSGSANQTIGQYDAITLKKWDVYWIQVGSTLANG